MEALRADGRRRKAERGGSPAACSYELAGKADGPRARRLPRPDSGQGPRRCRRSRLQARRQRLSAVPGAREAGLAPGWRHRVKGQTKRLRDAVGSSDSVGPLAHQNCAGRVAIFWRRRRRRDAHSLFLSLTHKESLRPRLTSRRRGGARRGGRRRVRKVRSALRGLAHERPSSHFRFALLYKS